jgi:hypothetical protein
MLLADALMLALHDMMGPGDMLGMLVILSIPFTLYLTLMTIAMYPGRTLAAPPTERIGNWEISR